MPRNTKSEANADILKGKKDDQMVWVENLLTGDSVYRSDRNRDNYPMAPHGFEGSVVAVPVKVAKEAFFRRAVTRGKVRMLSDSDATRREEQLIERLEEGTGNDRILESLEKGASDVGSRYRRKDLPDDGHESGAPMTPQQILGKRGESGQVRRSQPATEDYGEPAPEVVAEITEPVQEGEWKSDVG